ncbi:ATP-binding protein [Polluticoccus soli]|uniref:ATP-binding protein n=1 Tax=Polluticoccus soli TaxID=3034150 RepID=UPI0023E327D5|nr:ATP-binding protein [Flavipsychrobacter sp. JY13-12]
MQVKKIVVIGPESTGKSTLSEMLAASLKTVWVPEYAREYLEQREGVYEESDLLEIAKGQLKLEDEQLAKANKFLICDTDLYVLKVWSEHKYGRCHQSILDEISRRHYDMYLLTDIDIEWQDDPLREHPLPEMRQYFFNIYRDIVENSGVPWALVSSTPEERLKAALKAINSLI